MLPDLSLRRSGRSLPISHAPLILHLHLHNFDVIIYVRIVVRHEAHVVLEETARACGKNEWYWRYVNVNKRARVRGCIYKDFIGKRCSLTERLGG